MNGRESARFSQLGNGGSGVWKVGDFTLSCFGCSEKIVVCYCVIDIMRGLLRKSVFSWKFFNDFCSFGVKKSFRRFSFDPY